MSENIEEVMELPAGERIQAMLQELDKDGLRYRMLKTSVGFRAAWVLLAEHLHEVAQSESFKVWGYRSFGAYCAQELQITKALASKLLRNYNWLEDQAPQYLPRSKSDPSVNMGTYQKHVPDADTVHVLAQCYREVEENRLPAKTYSELKHAALSGERSARQLRKEMKEAIPEDESAEGAVDTIRHLRRALTEIEKALAVLDSATGDESMLSQAAQLRDQLFELVSQCMASEADEG